MWQWEKNKWKDSAQAREYPEPPATARNKDFPLNTLKRE